MLKYELDELRSKLNDQRKNDGYARDQIHSNDEPPTENIQPFDEVGEDWFERNE